MGLHDSMPDSKVSLWSSLPWKADKGLSKYGINMEQWLVSLFALLLPTLSFSVTIAASNDAGATGVGKAIGGALFGYIALKVINRSNKEECQPRGISKILIGVLVLVVLVAIFY
jgi:hypothetical protein